MGRNLEYPKKIQNTVKRHNDRGTYDLGAIHSIINETAVAHVAFSATSAEPFPAILPMIAVMGSFEYPSSSIDDPQDCYIHGYVSSRLMNVAKAAPEGLPVVVCATKVDGYVMAMTPFAHSYNYRSAVIQGYAKPVESLDEKLFAMKCITNKVLPNRWETTRTPPDNAEITSTTILKMTVVSGSGKIRDGGAHDEAKDTKQRDLMEKIWTGVVPVWETFGAPVPSDYNMVQEVPENISKYITETTRQNQEYATKAAQP